MKVYIDTDEKIVEIISGNLGTLIDSLKAIGEDPHEYEVVNSAVEGLQEVMEEMEEGEQVYPHGESEVNYTYVTAFGEKIGDC